MADDVFLTSTEFYAVRPDNEVVLRVQTGEGQVSGTAVLLNGRDHAFPSPNGPGVIGEGNLAGSILTVKTTVRDVRDDTNRTSLTYLLEGGKTTCRFPYSISVSAEKGTAHYLVTFIFTA